MHTCVTVRIVHTIKLSSKQEHQLSNYQCTSILLLAWRWYCRIIKTSSMIMWIPMNNYNGTSVLIENRLYISWYQSSNNYWITVFCIFLHLSRQKHNHTSPEPLWFVRNKRESVFTKCIRYLKIAPSNIQSSSATSPMCIHAFIQTFYLIRRSNKILT